MKKYKRPIEKESAKAIFYLFNKILSKSIVLLVLLFLIIFESFFMVGMIILQSHGPYYESLGFNDPYLYYSSIAPIAYSLMICPFIYRSISKSIFSNRLGSSSLTKSNFIFTIWSLFFYLVY